MKRNIIAVLVTTTLFISACSGTKSTESKTVNSKPVATQKETIEAPRGSKITGTIRPGSKFSLIKLGMSVARVNSIIGAASELKRHETGKRWIPLYYGSDTKRVQALYEGEGCLTFNGGNRFGAAGNKLIGINVDPSGACY